MKSYLCLALAVQGALAFPSISSDLDSRAQRPGCSTSKICDKAFPVSNEQINYNPNHLTQAQKNSKARTNCGAQGACHKFDAKEQYVSTHGNHRWIKPKRDEIRGPCPGLNAAANHNYLPRSGVPTIVETITGLGQAYAMSIDLAGFLAAYAIALDGDGISLAWSIGGPPPEKISLLGPARGISYSHNKYEGDSSIGRCDAYLNNGDAHSLSIQRFKYAYETGMDDDRYTLDKFASEFAKNAHRSINTNPLYFAPLFSTTLVSPAAYNFVINFMSNRTAENPSGYLNGEQFKQFFGVAGKYPNFEWLPGQERIPENWYRRTRSNPYRAISVFQDLIPNFLAYPDGFRFGGNTDGVNSYVGIDISNFTGGVINAKNLFEGDNFACFVYQELQQGIPDLLRPVPKKGKGNLQNMLTKYMDAAFGSLACPKIKKFETAVYTQYPGNAYNPNGPGLNC